MNRMLKEQLKGWLSKVFVIGQSFGVDILPRHFYSEIPHIKKMRNSMWWKKPFSLVGLPMLSLDESLEWLRGLLSAADVGVQPLDFYQLAVSDNKSDGGYGQSEAYILHCFIKQQRPKRIIQVGCGVSTAVFLRALGTQGCKITCIDPYPTCFLREEAAKGTIELLEKQVQEIDPSLAGTLEAGDLFFVDSSHCLGPAGEVSRLILEWLPRLAQGVFVHFHDIYIPYDYSSRVLENPMFFHHESVLLQAFLTMNNGYKVLFCGTLLLKERYAELQKLLSHFPLVLLKDGLYTSGEGCLPSCCYLVRE